MGTKMRGYYTRPEKKGKGREEEENLTTHISMDKNL